MNSAHRIVCVFCLALFTGLSEGFASLRPLLPTGESQELEFHAILLANAKTAAQSATANKLLFQLEALRAQCEFESSRDLIPIGCLDYLSIATRLNLVGQNRQRTAQVEITKRCAVVVGRISEVAILERGLRHAFISKSSCAPILRRRLAVLDYTDRRWH